MSKLELRVLTGEVRASQGEEGVLVGRAASFDVLSKPLGADGFRERIAPGAFQKTLADPANEVMCLWNHDPARPLGSRRAGTLRLSTDDAGLNFRCMTDKNSQFARDCYSAVKRGDVRSMSFGFKARDGGDSWDEGKDERGQPFVRRTLKDVELLDVSPVTYPAYAGDGATTVSARNIVADLPTNLGSTGHLWRRLLNSDADLVRFQKATAAALEIRKDARKQARDNGDWFSPRFESKDNLLADLQGALDDDYGEDCYRVVDACRSDGGVDPDSGYTVRGVCVARFLAANSEMFHGFDFGVLGDDGSGGDADEQDSTRALGRLSMKEVSSCRRGVRLCSPPRQMSPMGTVWSSSVRAMKAQQEHELLIRARDYARH